MGTNAKNLFKLLTRQHMRQGGYYESLEPEVQCDWRLLRKALLARYPPPDSDEDETQPGGSSTEQKPAPTGPHVPQRNARIGRIKVIGANSSDFGYLGDGKTCYSSTGIGAGASATEAISVCYVPTSKLGEIEIQRSDGQPQVLGVHWRQPSPTTEIGSAHYSTISAFNYEGLYRSSKMEWAGPGYTRIWRVMADNALCAHLEDRAPRNALHFFMFNRSEHQRYAVDVAADAGTFMTKYGPPGGWTPVKLLFEPVIQTPCGRSADDA
ncbi:hypothetical protein M407DRAFT_27696 [Tulasnella calospora MUT 4182]|uniref:Uncharacterized protein n=1 Tax=Tulasnella calospora MUT 4182 TaxID=1051891 RepID=A0A0C3QDI5_9AGAM|nr:hypothetical protein M407DRAFT_27696 [Tulasnella calospora MUT 4182]